jgi:hypothetical protein
MSDSGAAPRRAAVPISPARAEASRKNGARSRGPKTPEGKARSAQNALKHGLCALKYVVLPDESAAEFHALQEALMHELAPEGALQMVLARRVAVAAWRLARADPMEAEVFAERRWDNRSAGVALLGRRVGERGPNPVPAAKRRQRHPQLRDAAALPQRRHAEFMRVLRTLKALQAGQASSIDQDVAAARRSTGALTRAPRAAQPTRYHPGPNEPEPRRSGREGTGWAPANVPTPVPALHEAPAPWVPNEPELRAIVDEAAARLRPTGPGGHSARMPNEPEAVDSSAGANP